MTIKLLISAITRGKEKPGRFTDVTADTIYSEEPQDQVSHIALRQDLESEH